MPQPWKAATFESILRLDLLTPREPLRPPPAERQLRGQTRTAEGIAELVRGAGKKSQAADASPVKPQPQPPHAVPLDASPDAQHGGKLGRGVNVHPVRGGQGSSLRLRGEEPAR